MGENFCKTRRHYTIKDTQEEQWNFNLFQFMTRVELAHNFHSLHSLRGVIDENLIWLIGDSAAYEFDGSNLPNA